MRLEARAPLRIDLAGGWTDVPLYAETEGGAVVNVAISRYARGHISRPDSSGLLHALRGDRSYVSYRLDLPSGSGLGTSAAQNVLWLALVKSSIDTHLEKYEIAGLACRLAELLGILGGKQDEYASALGGIHFLSFDSAVHAERFELSLPALESLRARLVLVYSGKSRLSGSIHESVWTGYRSGNTSILAALRGLKRVAVDMRAALKAERIDELPSLLSENWTYQKELHSSVSNAHLVDLFDFAAANGATGGKACGAGGGGCCVFMVQPHGKSGLVRALRAKHLRVIDFDFDTFGVRVQHG